MQRSCERLRKWIQLRFFSLSILIAAAIFVAGCNADNIQDAPDDNFDSEASSLSLNKGGQGSVYFPIVKSKTFHFISGPNVYSGGTLQLSQGNGSHFHINEGALTPPPGTPFGEDVTITMEISYDSIGQELIFTFGPSECVFGPPARIKIDYKILGIENPQLYYIDPNGNYIPQTPSHINTKKRFMIIYVDHFSRYALAYS